jgi:AcrB/AcrD/AcrF family
LVRSTLPSFAHCCAPSSVTSRRLRAHLPTGDGTARVYTSRSGKAGGILPNTGSSSSSAILHFFIDRPIFAAAVSIIFVIIGTVSVGRLPIAQYPKIAPPVVRVSG